MGLLQSFVDNFRKQQQAPQQFDWQNPPTHSGWQQPLQPDAGFQPQQMAGAPEAMQNFNPMTGLQPQSQPTWGGEPGSSYDPSQGPFIPYGDRPAPLQAPPSGFRYQPPQMSGMPLVTKDQPGMGFGDPRYNPMPVLQPGPQNLDPQPVIGGQPMQGLEPPSQQGTMPYAPVQPLGQDDAYQGAAYPYGQEQMGQPDAGSFRYPYQQGQPGFSNMYAMPGVAQTSFDRGNELPLTGLNYLRSLLRG